MKPSENPLCSVKSVCLCACACRGAQVMFDTKCRCPYTTRVFSYFTPYTLLPLVATLVTTTHVC